MKRYDIACLNVNKEILFILESKIVNNIKFHENNVCTADQIIQKLKQNFFFLFQRKIHEGCELCH
jgi:hypothetical protein